LLVVCVVQGLNLATEPVAKKGEQIAEVSSEEEEREGEGAEKGWVPVNRM
jgi:hypothetical protein